MKQKDITLVVVIGIVSGTISLIISNAVFKVPKDRERKVEVVEAIKPDFTLPDKRYFNETSVNPTQLIEIKGNNSNPFRN